MGWKKGRWGGAIVLAALLVLAGGSIDDKHHGPAWAMSFAAGIDCPDGDDEMMMRVVDEDDDRYAEEIHFDVGKERLASFYFADRKLLYAEAFGTRYGTREEFVARFSTPCQMLEEWRKMGNARNGRR